jgi:hypothetical protein
MQSNLSGIFVHFKACTTYLEVTFVKEHIILYKMWKLKKIVYNRVEVMDGLKGQFLTAHILCAYHRRILASL